MLRLFVLYVIIIGLSFPVWAQKSHLRIKEIIQTTESTASVNSVLDKDSLPCAMVRISVPGLDNCTFNDTRYVEKKGVERIGADYILWMPAGEDFLKIQHEKYGELRINLRDYGIEKLIGKRTYRINIQTEDLKTMSVTMNTDPENQNIRFSVNGTSFTMVYVEGGTFIMGNSGKNADRYDRPHQVGLRDYYICETEITQKLWKTIMGTDIEEQRYMEQEASRLRGEYDYMEKVTIGENYPMSYINYYECKEFARRISEMTGYAFRLPTEAEWEYAARGGIHHSKYKYSGSNKLYEVTNNTLYSGYSKGVAQLKPNKLGIYDMTGSVAEWCEDWDDDYNEEITNNPVTTEPSFFYRKTKIVRGITPNMLLGERSHAFPYVRMDILGLRLVLECDKKD